MARIAFLLNNDFAFDARVNREALTLTKNGHEVTVFCTVSLLHDLPTREQNGSLSIRRIITKSLETFRPFTISQLLALFRILATGERYEVVHAHDYNTLLLGWMLARLWKAKLVYDSHELWQSVFQFEREQFSRATHLKPAKIARKLRNLDRVSQMEKWLLARCDAIISVNETLCRMLVEQAGPQTLPAVSVRNISNYFTLDGLNCNRFHEHFNLPANTRILLYQGDIKPTRGIRELLEAMERLTIPNLILILMGPIPDLHYEQQLKQRIQESERLKDRVFHKERVARNELLSWTASADLGIAPILNARESYYYCLPNKLFEYIQAGVPCATSNFPEMKKVIEDYNVGFTFEPTNPEEMAQKLTEFFADPKIAEQYKRNVLKAKPELSWENEQDRLLELYQQL